MSQQAYELIVPASKGFFDNKPDHGTWLDGALSLPVEVQGRYRECSVDIPEKSAGIPDYDPDHIIAILQSHRGAMRTFEEVLAENGIAATFDIIDPVVRGLRFDTSGSFIVGYKDGEASDTYSWFANEKRKVALVLGQTIFGMVHYDDDPNSETEDGISNEDFEAAMLEAINLEGTGLISSSVDRGQHTLLISDVVKGPFRVVDDEELRRLSKIIDIGGKHDCNCVIRTEQ